MDKKKHTHGFKMPEGYLDSFEDRLLDKIQEEAIPNETGFDVPDGYFDSIEERVMAQLQEDKETKVISIFSRKRITYAVAIAACLALVLTLVPWSQPDATIDLTASEVEEYLEDGTIELDTYDLVALIDDEMLSEDLVESELFSEDGLEDYILNNLDEYELIIE